MSISKQRQIPDTEIIVVDDCSPVPLKSLIDPGLSRYKMKIIRLQANLGPATARNRGAKAAKGKFLVFLDSDVELFPDTLPNLYDIYRDDPDIVAVTGVWVRHQKSRSFFPNFKALRDWSYWINERDKSGYYYLFSTRIASIKREVFTRLGGFDERYPGALVEDIELTYRIARRYAIIFAPNVRVKHEFEGFRAIAVKYFLRAYYWTKLYAKRKKFDPVATTAQEAITTISGVATVFLGLSIVTALGFLVAGIWNYELRTMMPQIIYPLFIVPNTLFILLFLIHLLLIRKFLYFMYCEKGLVFALKGFFAGLALYCFIFAGAVWGKIR